MKLKGKAIVAQSGGCTAVINQSLAGVVNTARQSPLITHVWGARYGVRGLLRGDFLDLKAQPPALLREIANLPSACLGSSRHKLASGEEHGILRNLRAWNVRYLFMIGGNDTAQTILRLSQAARMIEYDLRVLHIPKTIDNDLVETDHTPGYGSVARFVAVTTREAALDTQAMCHIDPVKIIEVMGRNSGWIVAAAALLKRRPSDAPHLLLIPEIPFDENRFIENVGRVLRKNGYCVIVMSETIRDRSGRRLGERRQGITRDPFGHQYVEGAAQYLARLVEERLRVRARYDKPGTIQRMSIPYVSGTDQQEAYQAGCHAVRCALRGISEVMVTLERVPGNRSYRIRYGTADLRKIPGRERYLPAAFFNEKKSMVTPAFIKYALPLLGDNLPRFPELRSLRIKI